MFDSVCYEVVACKKVNPKGKKISVDQRGRKRPNAPLKRAGHDGVLQVRSLQVARYYEERCNILRRSCTGGLLFFKSSLPTKLFAFEYLCTLVCRRVDHLVTRCSTLKMYCLEGIRSRAKMEEFRTEFP